MSKIIIILVLVISCHENIPVQNLQKTNVHEEKLDRYFKKDLRAANKLEDDFKDLKKKDDEACDSEEKIAKKLTETKKAFKLQGNTDGDCTVE